MAIAPVQSTVKVVTSVSSTTLAFGTPITSGNFITTTQAGFAGGALAATPTTPTDTLGRTYQGARAAYAPIDTSNQGRIYYTNNSATSGADTVTMGQANTGDFTIVIAEWSGGDSGGVLGASGEQGEATASNTSATTGSTGTRAQNDEMILAWVSHVGADTTITEDTGDGFTMLQENEGGSSNMPLGVQYKIVNNTTSITVNWTFGATRQYFGQEVTFKAVSDFHYSPPPAFPGVFNLDARRMI